MAVLLIFVVIFTMCDAEQITYIDVERPAVDAFNPKHAACINTTSSRYTRKNPFYYFNLSYQSFSYFGNNVMVDFYFYELLSNVYKRGFVEMHFLFCDLVKKDPFFGAEFRRQDSFKGPCPYPPGIYHLYNCTIPYTAIPKGFPFTKGRIYANISIAKTGELIASGHVDMELKTIAVKRNTTN